MSDEDRTIRSSAYAKAHANAPPTKQPNLLFSNNSKSLSMTKLKNFGPNKLLCWIPDRTLRNCEHSFPQDSHDFILRNQEWKTCIKSKGSPWSHKQDNKYKNG